MPRIRLGDTPDQYRKPHALMSGLWEQSEDREVWPARLAAQDDEHGLENFRSKGSTGQGAGQETCPLGRAALPFRITRSHQSESPRFRGIATGQAQLQQNFERLR